MVVIILLLVIFAILEIKFSPRLDIVYSYNVKTLYLWYTIRSKYNKSKQIRENIKIMSWQ